MAAGLLSCVWLLSLIICTPPWFVPGWGIFTQYSNDNNDELHESNLTTIFHAPTTITTTTTTTTTTRTATTTTRHSFACIYSPSVPYRIYSALGSFYIPLMVMLSVYFKIFRVASAREALMRQTLGTCRLSKRVLKTQQKNRLFIGGGTNYRNNPRCASAPSRNRMYLSSNDEARTTKNSCSLQTTDSVRDERLALTQYDSRFDLLDFDQEAMILRRDDRQLSSSTASAPPSNNTANGPLFCNNNNNNNNNIISCQRQSQHRISTIERECHSMADLAQPKLHMPPIRKNTDANAVPLLTKTAQLCHNRLQPQNLLAKAQDHYQTYGPGKIIRGSKEKMVYLRERKALKTIGIVVLGFIICWMPFFVLYLIEVFVEHVIEGRLFSLFSELFLWLGYSNSVLNPIIYTMYNGDFRRCFRDLLSFGCIQHHRRTMSVKKLHQQSTIF